MKLCMSSKAYILQRWLSFGLSLLFSVTCFVVAAASAKINSGILESILTVFFSAVGLVWLSLFSFRAVVEARRYCVDEDGITIYYLGVIKKFYSWSMFRKIAVCDFAHASQNMSNCFLIIRLSTCDEPCGPFSNERYCKRPGLDYWRDYEYTISHPNAILFIEFTPKRLEEICAASKLKVIYKLTRIGKEKYAEVLANKTGDETVS